MYAQLLTLLLFNIITYIKITKYSLEILFGEATFDRLMNCIWLDGSNGFKETMSFSDIDRLTYKLIGEEQDKRETREFLSNPYQ